MTHESENTMTMGGFGRWLMAGGVLVLLVLAFIGGRWTMDGGSHADARSGADASADAAGGGGGSETVYYCPMHPSQTSTNPDDDCPICGMDLVPMSDDAGADDRDMPVLRLTDRAVALMNVQVMPAERRVVTAPIDVVGKLEADETRLRDVVARSESYIETLYADHRWKLVEEGELLAEVYSPQVTAALRELRVVQGAGERAGREAGLQSAIARLERLGMGEAQIDEILATDEIPRTYQIRSPKAGHLMEVSGREGHWLSEGQRLFQIMDPWHLWLQLEVYERDLAWMHEGLPVELTVEAFPGETFEGEVAFIDPHVNDRTRTARVRIEVPNPDVRLRPGMFARGRVQVRVGGEAPALADASPEASAEPAEEPLVIPASAPLITGRRAVVYVQDPDAERPTFEGRQIVLGSRAGDSYLVREGLEEGELVVSRGAFKIDSELQIRGRPSMMGAQPFPEPLADPPTVEIPDDHPAYGVTAEQVSEQFVEQIESLYGHYLELVAGLAEDDFEHAREALEAYHDLLIEMDGQELAEEARPAWEAIVESLESPLREMYEATDLDGLRFQLEPMGEYTALAVQGFGGGRVGPLYRMRCPMAIHDEIEADWFQHQPELTNPYMGQRMLRCGSMVEQVLDSDGEAVESDPAGTEGPPADERAEHDVPEAFGEQVGEALQHYFTLSDAMAADDLNAARHAIVAYHDHLLTMDATDLAPEAEQAWADLDARLHDALHAMAEGDDLEALRRYLAPLSEATAQAAVQFGAGQVGRLYTLHCPMANDNEGANWLQPDDELNNPYMGQRMLRCGSVDEVLIEE